IMLFTPLVWDTNLATAIAIGGIRYFSLVSILPAFHLMLEFFDTRKYATKAAELATTAVQVVVLLLAILTRNSSAPVVGALAIGCAAAILMNRGERGAAGRIVRKATYMAIVGVAFIGVLMLSVSKDYLSAGRFTETVWHRIFVSLGYNPAWP